VCSEANMLIGHHEYFCSLGNCNAKYLIALCKIYQTNQKKKKTKTEGKNFEKSPFQPTATWDARFYIMRYLLHLPDLAFLPRRNKRRR